MMGEDANFRERLTVEAGRVRESGGLGRSEPLLRVFDFLLASSLAGRAPKELEVAHEVFGKDTNFAMMQDASVRVLIHRLRRKLDEYYARQPATGDRITVPLGEYRLVLMDSALPAETATPEQPDKPRQFRNRNFWIAVALISAINIAGWALYVGRIAAAPYAAAATSAIWKPLVDSRRRTVIVPGDYYIFGEAPDSIEVSRLIRDFNINSRADLYDYLMTNPTMVGRNVDVDLHYLPVSIGPALRSLVPVVNAAAARSGVNPQVVAASQLVPELLKNANIVYVGFLSGLGVLSDPVFQGSGFKIGANYDQLIDKASGHRFTSDWGVVADSKVSHRDYGYLASLPGPAGNRIVIVAGTRDAAVVQTAEIAADLQQLDAIASKVNADSFEALFEVRTRGNVNFGSTLVLVRPLRTADIWQPDRAPRPGSPDRPANAGSSNGQLERGDIQD